LKADDLDDTGGIAAGGVGSPPAAVIGGTPLSASELSERIIELPTARDLPEQASGPLPVALSLPALGVEDAPIDAVGVEPNGEMEIPEARRVGWYEHGARPGGPGSTVLAAHIAADGVDGVFRYLADAEVGTELLLRMDDGSQARYRIAEISQYAKQDLPVERVFARSGDPVITLVTCGGTFQPSLRSYQDNVVAYAVPVED
jgi:LPXTG-site transpeptidase (sortase) family protein